MVKYSEVSRLAPPRQNQELIGLAEAEQEFMHVFRAGCLHHAWLICGPRGIGKATLAYRMARYILAQKPQQEDGFGQSLDSHDSNDGIKSQETNSPSLFLNAEHPVFRRIASGSHADFLSIERSEDEKSKKVRKEIIVNDVRSIGYFLRKTPAEGGWRVVLVDAADELNTNASNALLKVLEEPPKKALLILVAHNSGRLLPTIRSRCRQLHIKPLNSNIVTSFIQRHAPETNEDELERIASVSGGSIGEALRLLESDGLEIYRSVNALLLNLPNLDIPMLHKLGDQVAKDATGETFHKLLLILNHWLTETAKNKAILGACYDQDVTKWTDIWEETNNLFRKAENVNLDRKQVTLNTFLEIAAVAQDRSARTY